MNIKSVEKSFFSPFIWWVIGLLKLLGWKDTMQPDQPWTLFKSQPRIFLGGFPTRNSVFWLDFFFCSFFFLLWRHVDRSTVSTVVLPKNHKIVVKTHQTMSLPNTADGSPPSQHEVAQTLANLSDACNGDIDEKKRSVTPNPERTEQFDNSAPPADDVVFVGLSSNTTCCRRSSNSSTITSGKTNNALLPTFYNRKNKATKSGTCT